MKRKIQIQIRIKVIQIRHVVYISANSKMGWFTVCTCTVKHEQTRSYTPIPAYPTPFQFQSAHKDTEPDTDNRTLSMTARHPYYLHASNVSANVPWALKWAGWGRGVGSGSTFSPDPELASQKKADPCESRSAPLGKYLYLYADLSH